MTIDEYADYEHLQAVAKMSRNLRQATAVMGEQEVRFLVSAYYTIQEYRKALSNQIDSANETTPLMVLDWLYEQQHTLEKQVKSALRKYVEHQELGRWMIRIRGVGEVISANLMAHIDIHLAETPAHIYRYGGYDPNLEWLSSEKAQAWVRNQPKDDDPETILARASVEFKRNYETLRKHAKYDGKGNERNLTRENIAKALARKPWNGDLKRLFWNIGESFWKQKGKAYYGQMAEWRKEWEAQQNELGHYADQAQKILSARNIGKDTDAYQYYSVGKLPPAQLHARAKRWAVKLFLSHFHEHYFAIEFNRLPPEPYAIAHLGHSEEHLPPVLSRRVYELRRQANRPVPKDPVIVD